MTTARPLPHARLLARNVAALAVTGGAVVALFVYPTSRSSRMPSAGPATSRVLAQPGDEVITGPAAKTQYGPVQVRVRIRAGRVVESKAVVYPTGYGLDDIVDARALPILDREAVAAQSAKIDLVSAATYTSDGYRRSLQGALDQAHLG